ncbi:hypothetical protein PR048_031932 [Dryococelus australis]|uniref:Uncharacterized protein n=1 Tax=Dryococelus australis TaxID=614101 RepID=A0ABQ9G9K7_9NEOP|nr:hypothetical protein PR048_031932 [Dryococelus australis]
MPRYTVAVMLPVVLAAAYDTPEFVREADPIHAVYARLVGKKAVQCWDTENGCAQPARSVYVVFSRRNERAGETGDPRENRPWWEASRLTAQPPWPLAGYIRHCGGLCGSTHDVACRTFVTILLPISPGASIAFTSACSDFRCDKLLSQIAQLARYCHSRGSRVECALLCCLYPPVTTTAENSPLLVFQDTGAQIQFRDWMILTVTHCKCIPTYHGHSDSELRNYEWPSQRHDGNTARLARRGDGALGVCVSVARIAASFLDLDAGVPTGVHFVLDENNTSYKVSLNLCNPSQTTVSVFLSTWPEKGKFARAVGLRGHSKVHNVHLLRIRTAAMSRHIRDALFKGTKPDKERSGCKSGVKRGRAAGMCAVAVGNREEWSVFPSMLFGGGEWPAGSTVMLLCSALAWTRKKPAAATLPRLPLLIITPPAALLVVFYLQATCVATYHPHTHPPIIYVSYFSTGGLSYNFILQGCTLCASCRTTELSCLRQIYHVCHWLLSVVSCLRWHASRGYVIPALRSNLTLLALRIETVSTQLCTTSGIATCLRSCRNFDDVVSLFLTTATSQNCRVGDTTLPKAVHAQVSTFETNLRKKSLPLPAYMNPDILSGMRPVKLVTICGNYYDPIVLLLESVKPSSAHIPIVVSHVCKQYITRYSSVGNKFPAVCQSSEIALCLTETSGPGGGAGARLDNSWETWSKKQWLTCRQTEVKCHTRKHREERDIISTVIEKCGDEAKQQVLSLLVNQATRRAAFYTGVGIIITKQIRKGSKITTETGQQIFIRNNIHVFYVREKNVPTTTKLLPIVKNEIDFLWRRALDHQPRHHAASIPLPPPLLYLPWPFVHCHAQLTDHRPMELLVYYVPVNVHVDKFPLYLWRGQCYCVCEEILTRQYQYSRTSVFNCVSLIVVHAREFCGVGVLTVKLESQPDEHDMTDGYDLRVGRTDVTVTLLFIGYYSDFVASGLSCLARRGCRVLLVEKVELSPTKAVVLVGLGASADFMRIPLSTTKCAGQEARERYGRQLHVLLVFHRPYAQGVQCFRPNAVLCKVDLPEMGADSGDCYFRSRSPLGNSRALLLKTQLDPATSIAAIFNCTVRYDGNTARLARKSNEALGVRVSVAHSLKNELEICEVGGGGDPQRMRGRNDELCCRSSSLCRGDPCSSTVVYFRVCSRHNSACVLLATGLLRTITPPLTPTYSPILVPNQEPPKSLHSTVIIMSALQVFIDQLYLFLHYSRAVTYVKVLPSTPVAVFALANVQPCKKARSPAPLWIKLRIVVFAILSRNCRRRGNTCPFDTCMRVCSVFVGERGIPEEDKPERRVIECDTDKSTTYAARYRPVQF